MIPPILVPIASLGNRPPKLCIHCAHYLPPSPATRSALFPPDPKKGMCKKTGLMNLIDGEIQYTSVALAREYDCKGDWYERKEPSEEDALPDEATPPR
jgi:hypothetical protein